LIIDKSQHDARKGAFPNQEHVVAKKVKKRVRREYTKAEEKELRAHSKVRTPVKK
jgi:hypothetical protein